MNDKDKRKERRSSILKYTKSEDEITNNPTVAGRRVSFADTLQVQEFLLSDSGQSSSDFNTESCAGSTYPLRFPLKLPLIPHARTSEFDQSFHQSTKVETVPTGNVYSEPLPGDNYSLENMSLTLGSLHKSDFNKMSNNSMFDFLNSKQQNELPFTQVTNVTEMDLFNGTKCESDMSFTILEYKSIYCPEQDSTKNKVLLDNEKQNANVPSANNTNKYSMDMSVTKGLSNPIYYPGDNEQYSRINTLRSENENGNTSMELCSISVENNIKTRENIDVQSEFNFTVNSADMSFTGVIDKPIFCQDSQAQQFAAKAIDHEKENTNLNPSIKLPTSLLAVGDNLFNEYAIENIRDLTSTGQNLQSLATSEQSHTHHFEKEVISIEKENPNLNSLIEIENNRNSTAHSRYDQVLLTCDKIHTDNYNVEPSSFNEEVSDPFVGLKAADVLTKEQVIVKDKLHQVTVIQPRKMNETVQSISNQNLQGGNKFSSINLRSVRCIKPGSSLLTKQGRRVNSITSPSNVQNKPVLNKVGSAEASCSNIQPINSNQLLVSTVDSSKPSLTNFQTEYEENLQPNNMERLQSNMKVHFEGKKITKGSNAVFKAPVDIFSRAKLTKDVSSKIDKVLKEKQEQSIKTNYFRRKVPESPKAIMHDELTHKPTISNSKSEEECENLLDETMPCTEAVNISGEIFKSSNHKLDISIEQNSIEPVKEGSSIVVPLCSPKNVVKSEVFNFSVSDKDEPKNSEHELSISSSKSCYLSSPKKLVQNAAFNTSNTVSAEPKPKNVECCGSLMEKCPKKILTRSERIMKNKGQKQNEKPTNPTASIVKKHARNRGKEVNNSDSKKSEDVSAVLHQNRKNVNSSNSSVIEAPSSSLAKNTQSPYSKMNKEKRSKVIDNYRSGKSKRKEEVPVDIALKLQNASQDLRSNKNILESFSLLSDSQIITQEKAISVDDFLDITATGFTPISSSTIKIEPFDLKTFVQEILSRRETWTCNILQDCQYVGNNVLICNFLKDRYQANIVFTTVNGKLDYNSTILSVDLLPQREDLKEFEKVAYFMLKHSITALDFNAKKYKLNDLSKCLKDLSDISNMANEFLSDFWEVDFDCSISLDVKQDHALLCSLMTSLSYRAIFEVIFTIDYTKYFSQPIIPTFNVKLGVLSSSLQKLLVEEILKEKPGPKFIFRISTCIKQYLRNNPIYNKPPPKKELLSWLY